MRKKVIQLPKGYLSYSQIQMWLKDRPRYERIYFAGEDAKFTNAGMDFGKEVASALEDGRDTGDLLTDAAMLLVPKYDIADKEIRVEMKTKDGVVVLVGRPDTMDSNSFDFREYKTGKTKWTLSKAMKHPQLKFYAMLIYVKFGKLLKQCHLDWIETAMTEEIIDGFPVKRIQPTGKVETFRVPLTLNDVLQTMAETARVAKEIEVAWLEWTSGQQSGVLPTLK